MFGDGTPVHITIPTDNPWVPLRILGLGKQAEDFIQADVFLLTDERAGVPPGASATVSPSRTTGRRRTCSSDDLRADAGMGWIPESAWLTKLERTAAPPANLRYDLAVDASGEGMPSLDADGCLRACADAHSSPSSLPDTGDSPGTAVRDWLQLAAVGASALAFLAFFVWYSASRRRDTIGAS